MVRSAAARALTLPVVAVFGFVVSGLIVRHLGVGTFAVYSVAASIAALLPFADLGVGAAVVNALADGQEGAPSSQACRTMVSALRVLLVVTSVVVVFAIAIGCLKMWPSVLGRTTPESANWPLTIGVVLFGLALPLGLGQRIALGTGHNEVQILVQGLQPVFAFVSVVGVLVLGLQPSWVISAYFLGLFLAAATMFVVSRRWAGDLIVNSIRLVLDFRYRGARIVGTALPMLVIMLSLPVVLQSHRILLSHYSDSTTVAQYALSAQFFFPILGLLTAASSSLWPIFARARVAPNRSGSKSSANVVAATIGVIVAVLGGVALLVVPPLGRFVSDGSINISETMCLSFLSVVAVMAVQSVYGYFLTDSSGLRYQACWLMGMALVGIPILVYVAIHYGANGVLFVTALLLLLFQLIPACARVNEGWLAGRFGRGPRR